MLDKGSVTKAAKSLYLSPAAISLQIRGLSETLGIDLFVRSGKSLAPTRIARELGQRTNHLLDLAENIRDTFHSGAPDKRPFRLAGGYSIMVYQLSPLINELQRLIPDNNLELSISDTEPLVEGIYRRDFDLGLVTLPLHRESLCVTPLLDERFVVAVNSSLRPKRKGGFTLKRLADLPWVLYTRDTNVRMLADRFFASHGICPKVSIEQNNVEAIKRLVVAGFGAALLPESSVRPPMEGLSLLPAKRYSFKRTIALAEPNSRHPRSVTATVREFLLRSMRSAHNA